MMEQDNRNDTKLFLVKIVHTLIWVFFVGVIAYVVYAGLMDKITLTVWVAISLVVLEGVLLLMNDGKCPLTSIAKRYTDRREDNFDISANRPVHRAVLIVDKMEVVVVVKESPSCRNDVSECSVRA